MSTPQTNNNPTGACASCRQPLPEYISFVDIVPAFLPWEVHFRYGICEACAALARQDAAGMHAMLTAVEAYFMGEVAAQ